MKQPQPDTTTKGGTKTYLAYMTQAVNTDPPNLTIIQNSIGTINWTRYAQGVYVGTKLGAFPANKTISQIGGITSQFLIQNLAYNTTNEYSYAVYRTTDDTIRCDIFKNSDFSNVDLADIDASYKLPIQISVYV